MEAELAVGFNVFAERYVSKVTMEPERLVIARARDTQLFHYLTNEWTFAPGPNPQSTWIAFSVDFQFRSILYAQASHLFFDEVVNKMVVAFERRCRATWTPELARAIEARIAPQDLIIPARGQQVRRSLVLPGAVAVATARASHALAAGTETPSLLPAPRSDVVVRLGSQVSQRVVTGTQTSAQMTPASQLKPSRADSRPSVAPHGSSQPVSAPYAGRQVGTVAHPHPHPRPPHASNASSTVNKRGGRPAPPLPGTVSIW